MTKINMKQAVSTAKTAISDLYADEPLEALALEEIKFVNQGRHNHWAVTLGFHRPKLGNPGSGNNLGAIFQASSPDDNRVYKTIYIDADTGNFVKMDMRIVQ